MNYISSIKLINPIIMKVVAQTIDGMNINEKINVDTITIGGKSFPVNKVNVKMLIDEAKKSGRMQVYHSEVPVLGGKIDAIDEPPLYTNGQLTVSELIVDDEVVWKK